MSTPNPAFEQRVRDTWPELADQVLAIIRGTRAHAVTYTSADARDRASYHPHATYVLKLEALNEVLDLHGVEYVPAGRDAKSPAFEYLNTGDSYARTIVYFPDRQTWRVTSWGDIVEAGKYD